MLLSGRVYAQPVDYAFGPAFFSAVAAARAKAHRTVAKAHRHTRTQQQQQQQRGQQRASSELESRRRWVRAQAL